MSEDQIDALNRYVAELAARDAPPYEAQPGGLSMLAGIMSISFPDTRSDRLARPIRAATLNWLTQAVAFGCDVTFGDARDALLIAIPNGQEDILDGGRDFIFAVDQAAMMLGTDPDAIRLRPRQLHS